MRGRREQVEMSIRRRHALPIRAELTGSATASALGISARSNSPILTLCRLLIRAGHNPSARLEAYRGSTLCLRVCSIGEGARLTVKEPNGGRAHFAKWTAFPSSPVASRAQEKELGGQWGAPPQEERRGVRHRRARRVPNFASMNHCCTARADCPNGTCARLVVRTVAERVLLLIEEFEIGEAICARSCRPDGPEFGSDIWDLHHFATSMAGSFPECGLASAGAHLALRSAQKLANLGRSRERASRTSHTTNARAH